MLNPKYLKEGDQIAIVSTARKISKAEVNEAIRFLTEWKLIPVIGKTVGLEYDQFAGTDVERGEDFQNMLDNPEIKDLWCARGGYGTVRIIDLLDFSDFIKNPKWIIGYSDITVLHAHIHNMGIQTIHAPMPVDIHKVTIEARNSFRELLFGNTHSIKFTTNELNRLGTCNGELIGGNLSILYSLCGSDSSISTKDKILCIEDLDEYLYHIDRMLQNLKRNGYFDDLAGLIVGGMTDMHDNNIPFGKDAKQIILDIVGDSEYPVVFDFPMGHVEDNRPLILGKEVLLETNGEITKLTYT